MPLVLEPIGYLRCERTTRVEAPRQPAAAEELEGVIRLLPGHNYEHALEDLEGWERIWVIFWFHLNPGWRPKVLPPRSASGRKGVFSTRSPHRPNPLGLSALKLVRVEGLDVHVRGVDLLDGTPVLDIKPYVAYTDAWPDSRAGWLATSQDPAPRWDVVFTPRASSQLEWIAARDELPLRERIVATLSLGPQPHPYRRIKRDGDRGRLAVREWRADFVVEERLVRVTAIHSGYRRGQLAGQPLHSEFVTVWEDAGND